MKINSVFTVALLCLTFFSFSQTIQNSSYSTQGYIKEDGTVQNASYSTLGYFKSDGTVQNAKGLITEKFNQ